MASERYTGGHINETYFATYAVNGTSRRYVHQRINTYVFHDVGALAHNVTRVTGHLAAKYREHPDSARRVLRVVPTRDGHAMLRGSDGAYWRTYEFIEGTTTRRKIESAGDAYAAAHAFGEFAAMLADLPANDLLETIPGFHDTVARVRALQTAVSNDAHRRAASAADAIAAAQTFSSLATRLLDFAQRERLPLRATHNDTKITNVLFDAATGQAVCVVDLDTVMPGLTLFDAGEMIRTAATRAAEDEPDPARVLIDEVLLDAVLRGFAGGAGGLLTNPEREMLVTAGRVLAYENGVRFLTDYLDGDKYFRVEHDTHNLQRARAQFALVRALEPYEGLCPI